MKDPERERVRVMRNRVKDIEREKEPERGK